MSDLVRRALQKRPHLQIKKHRDSLDFIFKFEGSVTRALREDHPRLYRILFEPRTKRSWTNTLMLAYHGNGSERDKKSVKQWLRFWLNRIFVNAFDVLLDRAISENLSKEDRAYLEKQVEIHKNLLRRKSGPRKSKRRQKEDAIRLARRHLRLVPQVRSLKAFVLRQQTDDERVLREAAEKTFRFQWLRHVTQGAALQHLPTINNDPTTTRSHLNGGWSAWQLSVGIIYCEEEVLKGRTTLQPNTIYKYINRGNILSKKRMSGRSPA
jgi:hypothetical protein